MNIRKKVDLSINILILFFFILGLAFSIIDLKENYENYLMFLVCLISIMISYYTNITVSLISLLIIEFGYLSYNLYKEIVIGSSIPLSAYFWLIVIMLGSIITNIVSININKIQKEIIKLDNKNKQFTTIDEETNLRNIKSFMNEYGIYTSMTKRYRQLPLTLMLTKIKYGNNMKNIIGKEEYKKIIKSVTDVIQEVLREEDRKYILNEDTFAYMLITDEVGAEVVKNRLKSSINELSILENEFTNRKLNIEIQIGYYEWNSNVNGPLNFLELAQAQMEYDV